MRGSGCGDVIRVASQFTTATRQLAAAQQRQRAQRRQRPALHAVAHGALEQQALVARVRKQMAPR